MFNRYKHRKILKKYPREEIRRIQEAKYPIHSRLTGLDPVPYRWAPIPNLEKAMNAKGRRDFRILQLAHKLYAIKVGLKGGFKITIGSTHHRLKSMKVLNRLIYRLAK